MSTPDCTLTQAQHAAIARIAYALESPSAIALLCGPAGAGKTTVLDRLAASPALAGRRCVRWTACDEAPASAGGAAGGDAVLLLDDAHEPSGEVLVATVEAWRRQEPRGGIVLAGQGRLLTLSARDARLERTIVLRAVLGPFTLSETRAATASRLGRLGRETDHAAVVRTIHEIAAGIPARVVRLAELVQLVADAAPGRVVTPDDVEAVHRRLSLQAA